MLQTRPLLTMLETEPSLWCLIGPSRMVGLARHQQTMLGRRINQQLPLAEVETAFVSMPHRGLGTSANAPRATRATPTSPMGAQVSYFTLYCFYIISPTIIVPIILIPRW